MDPEEIQQTVIVRRRRGRENVSVTNERRGLETLLEDLPSSSRLAGSGQERDEGGAELYEGGGQDVVQEEQEPH